MLHRYNGKKLSKEKTGMNYLEKRNQKIIDAIIEKANLVCPGSLALIGINGSFMTGDYHQKSDLDLLILINDDRGWQLGSTFIQDDLQVGHDIYCTSWEGLKNDARYEHPNISKLMDAKIVYCADEKYKRELERLQKQVKDKLSMPFDKEDYNKAENMLKEAEHCYTMAMLSESKSEVLDWTGGVIYYIENAIAMLNKKYFRYGVKRTYEELSAMKTKPERLCELIDNIIFAESVKAVKEHVSVLIKETIAVFNDMKKTITPQKKSATKEELTGTYEEMYSNWRNKMYLAAETGNVHLAFMSIFSANHMFSEIYESVDIEKYDAFIGYNPQDLKQTAKSYSEIMEEYLKEYRKAGIQEKRYCDIDKFVVEYQKKADNNK